MAGIFPYFEPFFQLARHFGISFSSGLMLNLTVEAAPQRDRLLYLVVRM